ncbi:MAG: hypothetical protein K2V38_27845 [Gemmataceae bacterium]|nr:hypothetical protein [Gemmataceae bacterium]
MTLTTGARRQVLRGLAFAGVAVAGYLFGVSNEPAAAQPGQPQPGAGLPGTPAIQPGQPQPVPNKGPAPAPEPDRRITAYIYGNIPITREELGEFLIARGGHEKLELLVNKKIIELEAARHKVTVTPDEIKAALIEDARGLGITVDDFAKRLLPNYKKTLFEWTEDVIRPRLLLTKMCQGRIQITEDELQKMFENRFGERRQAKIITWSAKDLKIAQKQWDEARKGDAEFDSIARTQADPNLAAACGLVKPVGRHVEEGGDAIVVKTLFSLKLGEISGIIEVPAGLMCVKYVAEVKPDPNAKFDAPTKEALRKELHAQKMEREIPKLFGELKAAAKPVLYLKGPPTEAEFREGTDQIIRQALPPQPTPVQPAGGAPMPKQ